MRPMIKYRGGKTRELPHIVCHIPRFTGRYIEPFLGGGAVYFHLQPREAILNDVNAKLMGFYQGVRDDYDTLREELRRVETLYTSNRLAYEARKKATPTERVDDDNEELYYRLRAMFNGSTAKEYSDAFLYYFINKTAYSGMIRYNAEGEFNVPYGRYPHLNTEAITPSHNRLLNTAQLLTGDFEEALNLCAPDDFVFLDPPYDCVFSDYGNEAYREGFNESEHRRLASDFKNLPCKTLMVIGKTPLIEELYRGRIVEEYGKNYAVNIRNRFKATARHIVVANYRKGLEDNASQVMSQVSCYRKQEVLQPTLFEETAPYGQD